MKLVLKNVGGPSPGLRIIGERESFLELAASLRTKVEQATPGIEKEISLVDSCACDGSKEWISLQVVSDIQPVIAESLKRGGRLTWGVWTGLAVALGILILAGIGLMSLVR